MVNAFRKIIGYHLITV